MTTYRLTRRGRTVKRLATFAGLALINCGCLAVAIIAVASYLNQPTIPFP